MDDVVVKGGREQPRWLQTSISPHYKDSKMKLVIVNNILPEINFGCQVG